MSLDCKTYVDEQLPLKGRIRQKFPSKSSELAILLDGEIYPKC
jgi:hypothetical protein